MKGLMRNNYYAVRFPMRKSFAMYHACCRVFLLSPLAKRVHLLMIGYMLLLAMIGFSFNSIASLRKESTRKMEQIQAHRTCKAVCHCAKLFSEFS